MSNPNFTLLEKLSESSTTVVHKAYQPALDRNVLLKILHKHLANDPEISERFRREARTLATLRSEHIVQVFDLTDVDGSPAIVMEFVDGRSLKSLLDVEGIQTFDFVKKTALHVLRGLSIAHEHGIVHRDIKPGNILIDRRGIVKVTDFGLATLASSSSLTLEGIVLGTPAYMSPEQIRGETLDGRTDLFSFGATLIELLTGKKIFDGVSYTECIKKVASFKTNNLIELFPNELGELFHLVQQLMEPNPDARISSAHEALALLGDKRSGTIRTVLRGKNNFRNASIAAIVILFMLIAGFLFKNSREKIEPTLMQDSSSAMNLTSKNDTAVHSKINENSNPSLIDQKKPVAIPSQRNDVEKNITSAVIDSGFLTISSKPWAKVYLNDQYLGETPIAGTRKIRTGTYNLIFNNPMFEPIVQTVTINAKEETSVAANFLEQAGYFLPQVTPWAEVYIDDQYRETTPLSKPLIASLGKRKIRFHNPSFNDIVQELTIAKEETVKISIRFTK